MDQLIVLILYVVLFAIVGCGLWWVCTKFRLPEPVLWICGVGLLIVILLFVSHIGAGIALPKLGK